MRDWAPVSRSHSATKWPEREGPLVLFQTPRIDHVSQFSSFKDDGTKMFKY